MADFGIKPEIALGVKPAPTMTLPEMLNFARGAQMYQKETEYLPLYVRQQEAATKSAEFKLDQDQSNYALQLVGGYRNDPRINSGDPKQTFDAMLEIRKQLVNAGIPSQKVDGLMQIGNRIALEAPAKLPQYFDNVIQGASGSVSQLGLQVPEVREVGGQIGLFRKGPGTITPANIPQAPAAAPAEAPAIGAGAPSAGAGEPMAQPAVQPTARQPEKGTYSLPYPVRQPGMPAPMLPQEKADQESGTALRNALGARKLELTKARRDVDEVIRKATEIEEKAVWPETGAIGAVKRKYASLIGDPTYQELKKDLANIQISNTKALGAGGGTVYGQQMNTEATGELGYEPGVIRKIAQRTKADLTNLDMMQNGLEIHSRKYGDNNAKRYMNMWADNADSRVFEIMNIAATVDDPTQRIIQTGEVLGQKPKYDKSNKFIGFEEGTGISKKEREKLDQKYKNILKLTNTGDLYGRE